MKLFFFILAILLISIRSIACGWGEVSDLYFFYNLFKQTNISGAEYYPFLRTDDHTFYETDNLDFAANRGNVQLWQDLLPHWTADQINKALLTSSNKEFEQLWSGTQSSIERSARQYMTFARKCSSFFKYRYRNSWDYEKILEQEIPDISPLLEEGIKSFKNENEEALQLRYAYQLIRILHYSGQYQEAIAFFQDHVALEFDKNELYYYALDQVGGCYFSLENYEYAAFIFIQVFNHSLDRKKSAFLSYNFCTNYRGEGKSYFDNINDTIGYLTIKNLRSFSDDLAGVRELMKVSATDERTELLFMRAINNLERRIWPSHIGMGKKLLPYLEPRDRQQIKDLIAVCREQFVNPKVIRQDFWLLAASYLHFLDNDLLEAKEKIDQVKDNTYRKQKDVLLIVYDVFSWKHISGPEETYLASILDDRFTVHSFSRWDTLMPAWYYLIIDQAAHLYYKDFKLAKAFLLHNRIETIETIGSQALIDDLIAFEDQEVKNEFEKILMRHATHLPGNISARDYMLFMKGLYYLQLGDAAKAFPFLNKSTLNTYSDPPKSLPVSDFVYATIFSNNTIECFNCPDTIMTDSVFLANPFSFIQPSFSKADLASYLMKLDSLTTEPTSWKRKLAHYLLGNYYFNVSNTGYFRGTLSGQSNCCNYRYFFNRDEKHDLAADLIDMNEGFNLLDVTDHYKLDNGLAKKAYEHYKQVISQSTDKELNARCLYMMSKCELNAYYNSGVVMDYGGYNGSVDSNTKPFKNSFAELEKEYKGTKFYRMIIRECSFFRCYCSL